MALRYYRSDELPSWEATVTVNGDSYDYTTGWTFTVTLTNSAGTVALTKTDNITGATAGVITVAWEAGELDLTPGVYRAVLVADRTSDGSQLSIEDAVQIVAR